MQKPVSLYLFAHQDDEFGVMPQIVHDLAQGGRVVCAYFTTGVPKGGDPSKRNYESIGVLRDLGVGLEDILFVGETLSIPDGSLAEYLGVVANWIENWARRQDVLGAVYVTAWEGGHPDHDCLHAVAVVVLTSMGMHEIIHQFPLYNGYRCPGAFFAVLSPLEANGPVRSVPIDWLKKLQFLRYCLRYPSQAKSWIGLFPFVLIRYLLHGYQELQPVSIDRVRERPHSGRLYYEKRKFATWDALSSQIFSWSKAWHSHRN